MAINIPPSYKEQRAESNRMPHITKPLLGSYRGEVNKKGS
nr:MAG TPA: hypothetical protein [Caudoviricetes sp.]